MIDESFSEELQTAVDFMNEVFQENNKSDQLKKRLSSKKRRLNRKNEKQHLEVEKQRLELLLFTLQSKKVSFWEKQAKQQALLCLQAKEEKKQLHEQIQNSISFNRCLQRLVTSNPPTKLLFSNELYTEQLGADPSIRSKRIDAMFDRQYRKLASVLLQTGFYEAKEDVHSARLVSAIPNQQEAEILMHFVIHNAHFRRVAKIIKDVQPSSAFVDFMKNVTGVDMTMDYLGEFDSTTQYFKARWKGDEVFGIPIPEEKYIIRYFDEADRVVIIRRTIVDDDLFPNRNKNSVQQVATHWFILEDATQLGQNHSTRVRVISKTHLEARSWEMDFDRSNFLICKLVENSDIFAKILEKFIVDFSNIQLP